MAVMEVIMRSGIWLTLIDVLVSIVLAYPMFPQVTFFQPPTYAGVGNVFVADFNGDGKPDLLISDGSLQLGVGNGTFTAGTNVSGTPLAVADFNGDGKPDILELGTATLVVLLGNGDGTFQPAISTPSSATLVTVAAADLKGNGRADVVGVFNSSLLVYTSNGDGTFAQPVAYALGTSSLNAPILSIGDFNGDIKADVAVGIAGEEIVLLGNGDGTLKTPAKTSTAISGMEFAGAGDFNGDGKLDLALSHLECGSGCPGAVYILLGNGDGTFQTPVQAFIGDGPLVAADVNGDGKLDLLCESGALMQIYLGKGNGTFSNASSYALFTSSGVGVADFDADGKLDVAVGGSILLGNGDGTFQGIPFGVGPNKGPASSAPNAGSWVAGPFGKNHTQAMAVLFGTQLGIFATNGANALSLIHTYTLQQTGYGIVVADFNGDGKVDLVVGGTDLASQNWGYSVLLGVGDGSFQSPVFFVQSGTYWGSIAAGDFNNDHKLDLAVAAGSSDELSILLGHGDGTFAPPVPYYDAGFSLLLIGDFNGDGNLDIAAGGQGTVILFGNGDGTFKPAVTPASLNGFSATLTADVNNDGKPDLICSGCNYHVALGNGDGTFRLVPESYVGLSSHYLPVAIADFNGDGKADYLALNPGNVPMVILGNGDGTFGSRIGIPGFSSTLCNSCSVADVNGDGRPDMVFPGQGPISGVAVLLNTTPSGFGMSASGLSPATVTAGDSANSTVTVTPIFGFNGSITISCESLPSGASCAFNPPSIANSSGTSTLTITTSASTAAGTYPVQVHGNSGSVASSVSLSLVVQAPPDFTIGAPSGSSTSRTISAGQTASFSLALAPAGSFSGTVNLSCSISPAATPAPTCSLSSSSVQISDSGTQPVTVNVGTTGSSMMSRLHSFDFPLAIMPLAGGLLWLGSTCLRPRNHKRVKAFLAPSLVLVLASCLSCGGGSSPAHNVRTPSGTYAVTITATSGSLSHRIDLQVIVR
jgi:FG-GAP-like repeat